MIKFSIEPNNFTHMKEGFYARTYTNGSCDLDDLIERMDRLGSTMSKADMHGVWELMCYAIEKIIDDGFTIKTPLFNIRPAVSGPFDSSNEHFKRSKHRVRINFSSGTRIKRFEKTLDASRTKSRPNAPIVSYIYDYSTKSYDQKITLMNMGRIAGRFLKFDPDDLQQGIFMINELKEEIRITQIADNLPSRLTFIWPAQLPPGTYSIKVRARKADGTLLNSVSKQVLVEGE
ncbi:MAG: DUF4469 domain-containing protein [Bacteroidales bacterium]|nr:DUF4469 domain-containing protein [Bacteroidales bacterium]